MRERGEQKRSARNATRARATYQPAPIHPAAFHAPICACRERERASGGKYKEKRAARKKYRAERILFRESELKGREEEGCAECT